MMMGEKNNTYFLIKRLNQRSIVALKCLVASNFVKKCHSANYNHCSYTSTDENKTKQHISNIKLSIPYSKYNCFPEILQCCCFL